MQQHAMKHQMDDNESEKTLPVGWQDDDYWTEAMVSRYVKLHRTQVRRLEEKKIFPSRIRVGERRVLWLSSAVKGWMRDNAAPAAQYRAKICPRTQIEALQRRNHVQHMISLLRAHFAARFDANRRRGVRFVALIFPFFLLVACGESSMAK